jgi:hypothetical protein
MKPKNTSLVNIGYLKNKNTYHTTFKISNLDAKQRKRIIERRKTLQVANFKIFDAYGDLYVFKYFTAVEFEVYKSLLEPAKKGVVPKRIEPDVLECELDICMLEEEMEIHLNRLKEEYSIK